jgi:SWI/SNF-related matrix-associated actin-dependent regulator 1 of chromatin subfamily A
MIRRLRKDVLPDLPTVTRSVIPLEIDNRSEYNKAERDLIKWVRENRGEEKASKAFNAEALVRIEVLKQLSIKGKIGACIEWIEEYLESGKKLVVFTMHRQTLTDVVKHFKGKVVKLEGKDNLQQKQYAVDQFQKNDKIKLFVGNLKAAGNLITLTAADSTCHLELAWNPSKHDQGESRVCRIGQLSDKVNAYYLLAYLTIEERISKLIDKKRVMVNAVLDGEDTPNDSMLSELLNMMLENEEYTEDEEYEACLNKTN